MIEIDMNTFWGDLTAACDKTKHRDAGIGARKQEKAFGRRNGGACCEKNSNGMACILKAESKQEAR